MPIRSCAIASGAQVHSPHTMKLVLLLVSATFLATGVEAFGAPSRRQASMASLRGGLRGTQTRAAAFRNLWTALLQACYSVRGGEKKPEMHNARPAGNTLSGKEAQWWTLTATDTPRRPGWCLQCLVRRPRLPEPVPPVSWEEGGVRKFSGCTWVMALLTRRLWSEWGSVRGSGG